MNPRCDKCIKKVKKFQKCWRMPGEMKCMMCLHQKQLCSIDPAYAGPKKRRQTETDASMRRMPTRGTSNMSANLAIANDVELAGESQQVIDSGVDVDAAAEVEFGQFREASTTGLVGLKKARVMIEGRLESSAFELRLILDDWIAAKSLLADIVAKIEELEALEAEAEGESEVEEDELVEEMVDE